jgi:choline transport protein
MTNMATASRQLFAFARDKGVPFSGFFSDLSFLPSFYADVYPRYGQAGPSLCTTALVASALSSINIGSTIAFNQITSLGLSALLSSYLVSISCIALKRIRKEELLTPYLTLGKYGLAMSREGMNISDRRRMSRSPRLKRLFTCLVCSNLVG